MIEYLSLIFIKILDNCIITAKNITTYQGKKIVSSILVTISQLLFYLVISKVINDNTFLAIILVSVSSGVGTYLGFIINDKFKKDDVWQNIVTSSSKEMLIELCEMLRDNHVKYLLYETLNRNFEPTYTVTAFTKTKAESKLIDNFLDNTDKKYLRMIDGKEIIKE